MLRWEGAYVLSREDGGGLSREDGNVLRWEGAYVLRRG